MPHAAGLYYELHGPTGAPPAILSSGLGGSASYWAPNIGALAQRHRVLVYDHRGTGRSDRAPLASLSLGDLGRDLLTVCAAAGFEGASVIGHVIGGMAGLEAARLAPDRIDRLVVINGWASLDPQTARCFAVRLSILRSAGAEAYLEAQPLFLFPAEWLSRHDAELRREAEAHLVNWPGTAAIEQRIGAAQAFDAKSWLEEIQSPVLLYSAADDLLVPSANSRRLAALLPRAQSFEVPYGGHACNVTDPETFTRTVLAFLRS